MDKIIYVRSDASLEPQTITFEVKPDLQLKEFKLNCIRIFKRMG